MSDLIYEPSLFRLEPETHEYFYGFLPVPGLSKILQAEGVSDYSGVPAWILERARQRGKLVHESIENYLHGREYDAGQYDAYVDAAKQYLDDHVTTIKAVEESVLDIYGWVACTPDLVAGPDGSHIIEWKTSRDKHDWHSLQLAGQASILDAAGRVVDRSVRRTIVYLLPDGTYDPVDIETEQAAEDDLVWECSVVTFYYKNRELKKLAEQGREYISNRKEKGNGD